MGALIERFALWWNRITCQHLNRIARFKIIEEYGIGYWQCPDCGAEWEDE